MPIINFVFTTYLQNACLRFNEAKTQDDVDQVLFGESISQPPPKAVQGTILTGGKKLEMRRVLNDKLANRKVYLKSFEKPFSETTANFLVRPDVVPARIKTYMVSIAIFFCFSSKLFYRNCMHAFKHLARLDMFLPRGNILPLPSVLYDPAD